MPNGEVSTLLFVINPVSGGKEKINWREGIEDYFKGTPHRIAIQTLSGKNDKQDLKEWIEQYKPGKIIAVGGDGTVKLVAESVLNTEMQLGILPAGSANGMAKELGIPLNIKQAIDVVNTGTASKIDAIQINDNDISIHLSDIGLNALIIKYFSEGRSRGLWGYVKVFFRVFRIKRLERLEIRSGERSISRIAYMVVIANAKRYGTGAVINPGGDLYDGKFEVVIIRKLKLFELFKMLLFHKAFNPDNIEVFQMQHVDICTHKKMHFQVDGEYRGKLANVKAKILPGALNVLLPPGNKK